MADTSDQALKMLADALKAVRDTPGSLALLAGLLYTPSTKLPALLAELEDFIKKANPTKAERQAAGALLEQIAFVAFCGLKYDSIRSFQSTGPQIDLLIDGHELHWQTLANTLRIDPQKRGILVEAKATEGPVSTAQFLRLCGLMHVNFSNVVSLGVFFTIKGATGFPEDGQHLRIARDARFEQMLFMARYDLPVIVLDLADIRTLNNPGALVRILESKIREIELSSGMKLDGDLAPEVDLPPHLKALL